MSEPPNKRPRIAANPYLDLEAAVDRSDELEEYEDEDDRTFIDDGSEGEVQSVADMHKNRQQLINILREEDRLDCGAALEEEPHAGLLHQLLKLKLPDDGGAGNPAVVDDEDDIEDDDEVASVPRPQWAEIAYTNAAVSGALSTWQDDDHERQISAQDTLFEVSCQPGMEETIAFRIFSWATQGASSSPGAAKHHEREPQPVGGSKLPLLCSGVKSSQTPRRRIVLARSAIANPFLRGRVYIESANIAYVQRLAQRVHGLNPASVRPVARELLLRPLLMARHSFHDRTFVKLLDPPCPSMTCLIVKDYLLMVPSNLFSIQETSSADRFNLDTDAMPDPPPNPCSGAPTVVHRLAPHQGSILIDQYGFRYFPLKQLGPSSLEAYEPSAPEVELLFKFGRLSGGQYKTYMSRIRAYEISPGDRVIFRAGAYDQLIGVILDHSDDSSCRVYVPSQDSVIQADRQQLRRHFCVGDRVSATTEDVIQKLGSRVGWVVGASEGFKAPPSSANDGEGKLTTQTGYRVDLRVYSPASGKEIIAAHYEFQFEDNSTVFLQKPNPPSSVSEMTIGTYYTLTVPLGGFSSRSFFGIIAAVEGVRLRHAEAKASTELSAVVVFSLWDKDTNTPFGYSEDWNETIEDFMDYDIRLGDVVTLRDQEGKCGTARITSLGRREVSLANFSGALKVSNLESVRRTGPYDDHIGKTVRVIKGPHRGGLGVVETVNTIGTCVVELNILPIRKISVNIASLCAVDQSALYLSLLPILTAPPPRAQTPPPQAPLFDTPPAFHPSPSDLLPDPPPSPSLDCGWLAQAFAQKIPIKLVPVNHDIRRPYHFSHTFYDNTGVTPRLMVQVFDRKKEREFAASELTWLPADDINQTVVRITGQDGGALYWTIRIDPDLCHVRQVPSKRGGSMSFFSRLELAQVNAKRT